MTTSSATWPLTFKALDHIHHGAGTAGNTSILRTQEIVLPDGSPTTVPYVSGNSLRHTLRAGSTLHALQAMQVDEGSLPKAVVDLLWSGGALTRTGSVVDLETPRAVADLYPALTLFGYSAGSSMVGGRLRVDNVHLACAENKWRAPEDLPSANVDQPAAAYRSDEFGTRHDAARQHVAARYLDKDDEGATDTTQMIYDLQTITPGAVLWSQLSVEDVTESEIDALAAAVQTAAPDGVIYLGAKSAVGYGKTDIYGVEELLARDVSGYSQQLAGHRDEITALWARLVG